MNGIDFSNTIYCKNVTWIREFESNGRNIEHIARHNVSPDEVEDVAFHDEPWIRKGRKGTRYMLAKSIEAEMVHKSLR